MNRPFTDDERRSYVEFLVAVAHSATASTITEVTDELMSAASQAYYWAFAPADTIIRRFDRLPGYDGSPWCGCSPPGPPDPWDMAQAPASGFYLYRLWGDADRLLYIGVSRGLRARFKAHRRRWGDVIRRATWEQHPTAAAMLAAEADAIATELPPLNVAGVG